jgi:translation elongation factor EF-G
MVPIPGASGTAKLGALCRVLSGTVRPGDWVRIAGIQSHQSHQSQAAPTSTLPPTDQSTAAAGVERVRVRRVLRFHTPHSSTDVTHCTAGDTCVLGMAWNDNDMA